MNGRQWDEPCHYDKRADDVEPSARLVCPH